MNRLNCGLMGSDPEGRLEFLNERLIGWLGYDERELVGKSIGQLVPPEVHDPILRERDATAAGDVRMRLTTLQRKDSTTFPVLVVPQRVVDEEDTVVGTFSVVLDMGAVETAKPVHYRAGDDVPERLERIARELQSIGRAARLPSSVGVLPLEHPELAGLSAREQEVLAGLAGGLRVPAIARELFISQDTVRGHLKSIFRKLGVSSQSDLLERVATLRDG